MNSKFKPVVGAVLGPVAGVALALGLGALTYDERRRDLVAYAVATMPMAAVLGAAAARDRPARRRAAALLSFLITVIAALVTAYLLAAIRFRALGSGGLISMRALPFTREGLMLVGLIPALAALGASIGTPVGAAGTGIVGALVAGPMLLVSAFLGGIPLLDPVVVTAVLVGVIGWLAARSDRGRAHAPKA